MATSESLVLSGAVRSSVDQIDPPSDLRVGLVSAGSVVLAVGVMALGLLAMLTVNVLAGLLILLGALPLWGWACVHNKALYH